MCMYVFIVLDLENTHAVWGLKAWGLCRVLSVADSLNVINGKCFTVRSGENNVMCLFLPRNPPVA